MRRILFLFSLLVGSNLMAQEGSVGIGTQTPNEKAVLHLVAPNNDQGFLVPKLTTTQRNNFSSQLTSAENGMMVFDSDLNQFFFWLSDHWEAVGSSLVAGSGLQIVDGVITNTGDTDASDDFSGDWVDLTNVPSEFEDGDDVDDADADPNNELQDLNLAGNILTITGLTTPTQIDLSSYISINTDEQDLQFSAGQISLSGDPDNTIIDLSNYDSDASNDFSGDWSDLQNIPAAFQDGSDDDADNDPTNEIELPATATIGEALKFNGTSWVAATDETDDADSDPGNELQDLNLTSNILTITGIGSPTQINLAAYTGTNTDEQDLQFSGNQISLTGDPDNTIIDLSNYDSNILDDFSGSFLDLVDVPLNLDLNSLDDFSGSFLDLTDVPINLDLDVTDDFSGLFSDLTGVPVNLDLDVTDDFSGSFLDLTNVPVDLDLDATDDFSGSFEDLVDIPFYLDTDATDDFSGSFLDLTDVPLNLDTDVTDDFSGSFLDLTNVPANLDLDATDDFSGEWGDLLSVPGDFMDGTDDVDDADPDPGNEFQDLSFNEATKTLSITNDPDGTPVDLSGLIDVDITDLLFTLFPSAGDVLKYNGLIWVAGNDNVNDADASTTNELQDLSFSGNIISLSNDPTPTSINVSAWDRNASDDFSGNWSDLSGIPSDFSDGTDDVNDADASTTNELQDLQFGSHLLRLSNDPVPNTVDLSVYLDNTDLLAGIAGDDGQVAKLSRGTWIAAADDVDDADADPDNELQSLQFEGSSMWLDRDPEGNSVDLSIYNTDVLAGLTPSEGQIAKYLSGAWVVANDENTDLLAGIGGTDGQVLKYFPADGGWQASTDFVDDADSDPNNEIELPATATVGQVLKYAGPVSGWVAGTDNTADGDTSPTNEIEFPETANDGDVMTYSEANKRWEPKSSGGGSQYAFKAGKSEDQNITSEGKNEIVTFRAESYDIGDVYDVGTSIFTAKVPGIYSFSVTIATIADAGADLDINLIVDETQVHSMVISGGPNSDAFSFFADVQLTESQKVRVEVVSRTSGRIVGKPVQTNWSGRLEMAVSR